MWQVCGHWFAQFKWIQIPVLNPLWAALGFKLRPFVRGHPEWQEGRGGGGMTSITGLQVAIVSLTQARTTKRFSSVEGEAG